MKKNVLRWFAIGTAASVCLTGTVWAAAPEKAEDAAAEPVAEAAVEETVEETAAEAVEATAAEAKADGFAFDIINKTGSDISYLSVYEVGGDMDPDLEIVRLQEALIELEFLEDVADGSFGPKSQAALEEFLEANNLTGKTQEDEEVLIALFGEYDDGNFLKDDEVLKNEASAKFDIVPELKDDAEDAEDADEVVEYRALFCVVGEDGEEKEYTLHVLPAEDTEFAILISDDDVAYIEYTPEGSDEVVSTLDEEKTHYVADQARADYSNFATYGDEGGYGDYSDYGNYGDYSYSAPAVDYSYAAPAYEDTSWINAAQGADDCADLGTMGATW